MPELPLCQPDLTDPVACWRWLWDHPAFYYKGKYEDHNESGFTEALDVSMWRDTEGLAVVSLEIGGYSTPTEDYERSTPRWVELGIPCHDPNLDSSGPTFEAALLRLADLVMAEYGDYVEYRICSHCLRNRPAGPTDPNAEWFCSPACQDHGHVRLDTEPVDGDYRVLRWIPPSEQFGGCEHHPFD